MKKNKSAGIEEGRRFWGHHLEQCRTSGLSQAEYCRRHGLSIKTFCYRKRTIGKAPLSLVEIPLVAPVCSPSKPLSLAVGTRYTIQIEPGFDADTLRELLEVLNR
jgi:hypothetical protein